MTGPFVFSHAVDVRYGECDQQGVVFNANHLAYVDDALDHWMRAVGELSWSSDVMVKHSELTWHSPASWPERVEIDCGVCRWGTTSFDVVFRLRVGDRRVSDVVTTYVWVPMSGGGPAEIPAPVRRALGALVERP
ncbi:MAG TPA: thioesterase family protein [Microthrixaceae bacterium]|nr:thioesterase family protein [Microthrixaceae bacterium]